MAKSRPCTQQASLSGLLSMADYIVESFPFLMPPFKFDGEWRKPNVSNEQPWEGGIYHPYYEIWNDVLLSRVLSRFAIAYDNTLFVDIELSEDSEATLKTIPASFEEVAIDSSQCSSSWSKLQQIFGIPKLEPSTKRFAMLATHHYDRKDYPFSMRICKDAIFLGILYNNEEWVTYYFGRGEIPTAEELASYDAVIMPGSNNSVLDWTE